MREVVIDTEATELDPLGGHRVVEMGAIELIDRSPAGQTFHRYVGPGSRLLVVLASAVK
jgi:DNA polymerase III subunit epsilon